MPWESEASRKKVSVLDLSWKTLHTNRCNRKSEDKNQNIDCEYFLRLSDYSMEYVKRTKNRL